MSKVEKTQEALSQTCLKLSNIRRSYTAYEQHNRPSLLEAKYLATSFPEIFTGKTDTYRYSVKNYHTNKTVFISFIQSEIQDAYLYKIHYSTI